MQLLDGKIARAHYTAILKEKIAQLSIVPCLLIIQVGDRSDSTSFIKSKKKFATEIGTKEIHINLDE
ncbi:MAG: tetrahydrofolate dehydrogenase/cyclohydrolase catalytic domain-containing protein, partial [Patescibacteria group bacterium]